jgi:quercetin dioxygenase-like cupin family protein
MQLPRLAFTPLALTDAAPAREPGETGHSLTRCFERAEVRVRRVEYAPGYLADHWCDRGHVFYLLAGEVTVELRDGRSFALAAGGGFAVSDHGDAAHRVRTQSGGVALIVD